MKDVYNKVADIIYAKDKKILYETAYEMAIDILKLPELKAIQVQAKVKPACVNCKHLKIEGGYIYARTCLCQNPKIRLWNLTNCDIDIKEFGCTYFESKSV